MTTTYDSDQTAALNTYDDETIVAAWSSSDLGELDDHFTQADAGENDAPTLGRAKLFAALAAGVIGGATVGAVLFGYQAAPPTAVVPGFGVSTTAIPAAGTAPANSASRPAPTLAVALPAQAPNPVELGGPDTAPPVDSIPNAAVDPGTPPASGPPAVDVWVPALPAFIDNKPQPPAAPDPLPPDLAPPNIVVVQTVPDSSKKPTGGLKPLDRSAINPNISKKPTVQRSNPANRATIAKP
jgi:hypothetical protein